MQSEQLAVLAVDALDELKAVDVQRIDVRDRTSITDFMVIASGTSGRHIKSLAERVTEKCRDAGVRALGVEGADGSDWILVDLGDVVVHVMLPERREFYNLEKLWSISGRALAEDGGESGGD